jgi:hypothetical protein
MIWIIWLVLLFLLLVVPLGWGYPRYGVPRPYYRRSTIAQENAVGWGIWASVLWLILAVLIIWAVLLLLF